jgi:hypothetical protein
MRLFFNKIGYPERKRKKMVPDTSSALFSNPEDTAPLLMPLFPARNSEP